MVNKMGIAHTTVKDLAVLDPNTHEFTLAALDYIFNSQYKTLKKINHVRFKNKVYFVATMGAIYYIYSNLNRRLKKLENVETE